MEVIYGLLPGMLLLGIIGVVIFFWAVKSGQYDDMDGAANRILMDSDQKEDNEDKKDNKNDDE
ncbi:MAG: cbb3-type cytochrome oxidase assembly protein CcoS [Methylophaga sp.]|nr:MAG: cbb3-type cytochrome oxidase assembly protein CcoS [Methylophaga sp.]